MSKPRAKSFKHRNFCIVNRLAGNAARKSFAVISLNTSNSDLSMNFVRLFYLRTTALNTFEVSSSNTTDG